jgi:hypothetical protein
MYMCILFSGIYLQVYSILMMLNHARDTELRKRFLLRSELSDDNDGLSKQLKMRGNSPNFSDFHDAEVHVRNMDGVNSSYVCVVV